MRFVKYRTLGRSGLKVTEIPYGNWLTHGSQIEAEVVPTSRDEGLGQIVWSPIAQGVLTGKYLPGQAPPAGTSATHESTQDAIARWMHDDVFTAVQNLRPLAATVVIGVRAGQACRRSPRVFGRPCRRVLRTPLGGRC